jgi:poly(3-hydroxyalkanoate) depolymerase
MTSDSDGISVQMVIVGGQLLRVARKQGSAKRPPLLLFNGISANLELAFPFMRALRDTEAVIFDVPGVGGSPAPMAPYRPSTIARLARDLALKLKLGPRLDVAGVSWGGGLAQQFARQYPQICRRLVLISTAPGVAMLPGNPSVLLKMASPRRYSDRGYMRSIAADLYGGAFRKDPTLIGRHADAMKGATKYGYLLQLAAMTGWTSIHWLHTLTQPTLVLAGTDDPLVPAFNARLLARLIPNSRLELIDDGHLFVVTHPDETARTVEDFLSHDDPPPEA